MLKHDDMEQLAYIRQWNEKKKQRRTEREQRRKKLFAKLRKKEWKKDEDK